LYYIDDQHRCFVHAGFNRDYLFHLQPLTPEYNPATKVYYWDRELWEKALCVNENQKLKTIDNFSQIFIGHTCVFQKGSIDASPVYAGGVWNLDTGAGWKGRLTIMDIDTHEYWQSDFVNELYPDGSTR